MIEQCKSAKIYVTEDYEKFVVMKGNRETKLGDIEKLKKKIKKRNLLKYHPILVNKLFEIVDGQHRLAVAKALKLPIYFMTLATADIRVVIDVNTVGQQWKATDYLDSYCKQGNVEYKILRDFLNKFPLFTVTQALGMFCSSTHKMGPDFKAGYFKATEISRANRIANILMAFHPVDKRLPSTNKFQRAIMHIDKNEIPYKLDRFVEQAYLHLTTLLALPPSMRDTMFSLNRVYGFTGNQKMTFTHLKPKESNFTTIAESPRKPSVMKEIAKPRGKYNWRRHEPAVAKIMIESPIIKYTDIAEQLKIEDTTIEKVAKALCSWVRNNYGTRDKFVEIVSAR